MVVVVCSGCCDVFAFRGTGSDVAEDYCVGDAFAVSFEVRVGVGGEPDTVTAPVCPTVLCDSGSEVNEVVCLACV